MTDFDFRTAFPEPASHAGRFASVTLGAAILALAMAAQGGTIRWDPNSGGDLAVADNWIGDVAPTSSDSIQIDRGQSAPIWLSQDLSATGGESTFAAGFTLALTNATGEARTLTLYRIKFNKDTPVTVRLAAGTLNLTDRFSMGDTGTAKDMGNAFVVDGQNTTFSGKEIRVGSNCSYSQFVATNGATLAGTTLQVGYSSASNGLFRIADPGSTATFSSAVQFGSAGGNGIEVLDGACLATTNLYVRRLEKYVDSTVWNEACSLRVSGTGSRVVVNGASGMGFYLGNASGPGCSVVVENGAAWNSAGEFSLPANTTNSSFRIASGATFTHGLHGVFIGNDVTADHPSFTVDAASATVTSDRGIEMLGTNATLSVVNGGTLTATKIKLGNGKGENASLHIAGADSRVSTTYQIGLNSTASLAIEVPAGGFTGGAAPVSCATLMLDAAAKMVVSMGPEMRDTGRIVLVEATNDISVPEGFVFELPDTASFPRGKVSLDLSNAKQIAVKVNCNLATIISFR